MERFKQQKSSKTKIMKPLLYVMLLMLCVSCHKEEIKKITVTGTVSDTDSPLDSVKVTLEETCFMCMGSIPIETRYSENGSFSFEFTPRKEQSYHLDFEKAGYYRRTYYVDLKQKVQSCTIIMERNRDCSE